MMRFNKKRLALAIGAALGATGLVPSAQAVSLATDGLGQALIFPYYTTRGGWNTLFNITNTSSEMVVAVKMSFHESYNSRDVFDFDIILSPNDVWTGYVKLNGTTGIPEISTGDQSCTVPRLEPETLIPFEGTFQGNPYGGRLSYTGSAADGGPTDVARMQEGYVTVIMMGAALATDSMASNAVHNTTPNHPSFGIPKDCGKLVAAFSNPSGYPALNASGTGFPYYAGINPLRGMFSLVNATGGQNAGGLPVTLANFSDVDNSNAGSNGLVTLQLPPASINLAGPAQQFNASFHEPSLNAANTAGIVLLPDDSTSTAPPTTDQNYTGASNVSWVLLRDSVINHWTRLDDDSGRWNTASDWVVTFPTKAFFVDNATKVADGASDSEYAAINKYRGPRAQQVPLLPTSPFSHYFDQTNDGNSCDPVVATIYDREEYGGYQPIYSPATISNDLCYEANVLTFDGSNILGSAEPLRRDVQNLPGANGWMKLDLSSSANTLTGGNVTAANPGFGLPVIGFSITTRTGLIPVDGRLLDEAYLVDHAYTRRDPFAPTLP